ncbi:MAG: hypothetical protein A2X69_14260 [Rhodobacteraceae bacterium GWF1_65_7]|nr:MAG: hypothetical protein A2X69_14260 [Rhodobacteraceae bacterium GWF1_65_7]
MIGGLRSAVEDRDDLPAAPEQGRRALGLLLTEQRHRRHWLFALASFVAKAAQIGAILFNLGRAMAQHGFLGSGPADLCSFDALFSDPDQLGGEWWAGIFRRYHRPARQVCQAVSADIIHQCYLKLFDAGSI